MRSEDWAVKELQHIRDQHLERKICEYPESGGKIRVGNQQLLNFSSNDTWGLHVLPPLLQRQKKRLNAGERAQLLQD